MRSGTSGGSSHWVAALVLRIGRGITKAVTFVYRSRPRGIRPDAGLRLARPDQAPSDPDGALGIAMRYPCVFIAADDSARRGESASPALRLFILGGISRATHAWQCIYMRNELYTPAHATPPRRVWIIIGSAQRGSRAGKRDRLRLVHELVTSRSVASQHELVGLLAERGYEVTQATISRDIAALGLVKVTLRPARLRRPR